jgi:hypothetical protein
MARLVVKEGELEMKLVEACRLLIKIRYYRRRWDADHDAQTLATVKGWEQRADEFLNSLEIEPEVQELEKKIEK